MRLSCCHLILLYPLLLMASFTQAQQQRQDTLVLHFAFDRYEVWPEEVVKAARFFRDSSFGAKRIDSVSVIGYTDKTGTMAHNRQLAAKRAAAVAAALALPGDSLPLHIIGGGIAPTPDQSDSANRRTEIVISYHPETSQLMATPVPRTDSTQSTVAFNGDSTQPSAVISLRHINFVMDTPIPTDATRMILPGYVTQLQQYKDRHLEIDGYVNSVVPLNGPTDPLFILSVKRAKYIYDYLVDAGFDPGKLTYKGMGNTSPVNPDPANREEMNANMRVEIKVY